MIAIFKREFRSLFQNFTGWLFLCVSLALFGLYFYVYNLSYGYPNAAYAVSGMIFIYIILVPILTMRMIAEERRNKTDQLILTAPVSVWKIVLGKFLALAAVFGIEIGIICLSPLVLAKYGTVPFAETYTGILGFLLYGLACLAIGLFASSLTENTIISAVLSFVFLFLGYMMSSITGALFDDGSVIATVLNCYDLYTPIKTMIGGVFDLSAILYYVSLILLMLFLTTQSIQKRRWSFSARKLSGNVFSVGMILVVIAAIVLANFGFSKIPDKYTELDTTDNKYYELTDATELYLMTVDDDITVNVLGTRSSVKENYEYLVKTLDNMEEANEHIIVNYVDTSVQTDFASQYTDEDLSDGSVIVVRGDKSICVSADDMYEYEFDYSSYSYNATAYDGEGQLVAAFQNVLSDYTPVIYQLTGHDEIAIPTGFTSALSKSNVELQELKLLTEDAVPENCELLIINGPAQDLSQDDLTKVTDYLANGGKAYLAVDYSSISNTPNYISLIESYGITVDNGVVMDNDSSYYAYSKPYYLLPYVEYSDVTTDITGSASVFVEKACGFSFDSEDENITTLMDTSDSSVCKTDVANATTYEYEDGDIEGPFSVGLTVSGDNGEELYLFATPYILDDDCDGAVAGRNSTLFTNIVNASVSTDSGQENIVVPSKTYSSDYLTITEGSTLGLGILVGIFLPLIMLIPGLVIFLVRRKK